MRRHISLAELLQAGITVRAADALAIARQLIHGFAVDGTDQAEPTPSTVLLAADGSVSCSGCALTVADLAAFIEQLVPEGTAGVPGSLRYTLARARGQVDAPPFESLVQFSEALARHERGDSRTIVRSLFDRMAAVAASGGSVVERRRAAPAVAELRRQLRDADIRVYEQQAALDAMAAMTGQKRSRGASHLSIPMGLALLLIIAGGATAMHEQWHETPAVTAKLEAPVPASETAVMQSVAPPPRRGDVMLVPDEPPKPTPRRITRDDRAGSARQKRKASPGILDRLHMRWLKKLTFRNDTP